MSERIFYFKADCLKKKRKNIKYLENCINKFDSVVKSCLYQVKAWNIDVIMLFESNFI